MKEMTKKIKKLQKRTETMTEAEIKDVSRRLGEVIEVTDRILKEITEFNKKNAKNKKKRNEKQR